MDTEIKENIASLEEEIDRENRDRYIVYKIIHKLQKPLLDRDDTPELEITEYLRLIRKAQKSKGNCITLIEEELFQIIISILWIKIRDKKMTERLYNLYIRFLIESFAFSKPREGFSKNRKKLVLETLAFLSKYKLSDEILEIIDKAFEYTFKQRRETLLVSAIECLHAVYVESNKKLPVKYIDIMKKIIAKTDSRTNLTTALSLLVDAGIVSEFYALDKVDEFKDKYYR